MEPGSLRHQNPAVFLHIQEHGRCPVRGRDCLHVQVAILKMKCIRILQDAVFFTWQSELFCEF